MASSKEYLKNVILYVHGKGGSAKEAELYKKLFPGYAVKGLNYLSNTPWEFKNEIAAVLDELSNEYEHMILVANSIGAFYMISSGRGDKFEKAFFISPIVDMERLICDMMMWANVTETELKEKGRIKTDFGEELSWEYLSYVRKHPIKWNVSTEILYGSKDNLTSEKTITDFAKKHNAGLTIMDDGEHWFHTDEQMEFLQNWIKEKLS